MKNVKLSNGLNLNIDENVFDDMRLVDDISALQTGDNAAISRIVEKVLGNDGREKVYKHIEVDGRVPVSKMSDIMTEIFSKIGEQGKN